MAGGRKPDYILRYKVSENRWITCGAAWTNDKGGIGLKLETIPVGFDGNMLLVVPKEEDQQ
jgi:hypothetical protein